MIPQLLMPHFQHPQLLWCLALVPVYALLRWRQEHARTLAFPPLQYLPPTPWRRQLGLAQPWFEALLLAILVVGMAGPFKESRVELFDDPGIDVLLALDVSLSMLAEDFPPTRIAALQETARDFLTRSSSHRVGILIFAGDVFVQSPLTTDRASLRQLLDGVGVYNIHQGLSGGTAVGDALLTATEGLQKVRLEGRDQAIVLITDGESNAGIDPVLAARYVRQHDIRLYIIGIGGEEPVEVYFEGERLGEEDSPYLAVLDDESLRAVAEAADGRYFRAVDVDALGSVFAELARLESAPLEAREVRVRRFGTRYLALVALPLFLLYLVLGGLVLRRPLR
jgi:Ca-activated chloride channel family protein